MPPEVLQGEVNWNDWESALKQADVYSFGLVLWEIVRKCTDFYDRKSHSIFDPEVLWQVTKNFV